GGAKADGLPRSEILVDPSGVFLECLPRPVQLAVVTEIVHADLEAMVAQEGAKAFRRFIVPLGHEVERRSEAEIDLELRKSRAAGQDDLAFNVVGEPATAPFANMP